MKLTTIYPIMMLIAILAFSNANAGEDSVEWTYDPDQSSRGRAQPPIPEGFDVQMVLDDDASEGDLGVGGATAQQFLWFNRFTPGPEPVWLDRIWVLFPPGPNMAVGAEVELVVYHDPDGDPTNGAGLVTSLDVTIQAVDGNTFSVYEVVPAIWMPEPRDVLIGVVDRFVTSGVTTTTRPAALDTTVSQGRSWLAVWNGDPPSPPVLPPDNLISTVDAFVPGNWMIRAFGRQGRSAGIPAQSLLGLLVLVLLVAVAGVHVLRR